jgi:hypothetical protein
MIRASDEYFLPVVVDDAWVDGLPTSTAHLDLRVHGVLGVVEMLVRKIRASEARLDIPPTVRIPRVPMGRLSADHLSAYLLPLCRRSRPTVFGALVYDERTVELRRLLRDTDYWDALDTISGPEFEVFALRDSEDFEYDPVVDVELLTSTSLSSSRSRGHYFSRLLRDYFGVEKTRLVYPSMLVFIAHEGRIERCRLIPLPRAGIDDTFKALSSLLEVIAGGIAESDETVTVSDLWDRLKSRLLELDYTLYIQRPPADAHRAITALADYMES